MNIKPKLQKSHVEAKIIFTKLKIISNINDHLFCALHTNYVIMVVIFFLNLKFDF